MSADRGSKRPRQEEPAIAALLSEPTIEAAAKKAGIGESTLRRWLAEEGFQQRYRDARRQLVEHAVSGLQRAAGAAVEALSRNLTCGVPAAEIAAAKAILDQSFKGMDVLDHAARIERLEQAQNGGAE